MTRFIITLDEAVALVVKAFNRMEGGEVFVPKIPSARILDIAQAVAPQCDTEVVGIRPGEKLHECMLPADEARQTLEFKDHFIIQPSFRMWTNKPPRYASHGTPCEEGFCYASDTNPEWLSVEQLRAMIGSADVPSQAMVPEKVA